MTLSATPSEIIAAVNAVVGDAKRPVALHEPLFSGNEKNYVDSCIEQGWVSSAGAFVERFERDLAAFCGAAYVVVTVNGTCALQAALVVLGVERDDEVLVPALTFVATANAVSHAGAVPHFVEVEEESLGVDPATLETYLKRIAVLKNGNTVNRNTGRIIRALVPVHVFGHPCRMDELRRVAADYNLALVEDATEALGSRIQDKQVGSEGVAVFSFNGNKIITTGGGGAIAVQDEVLYRRLKHLTSTAKKPHAWAFEHDAVAWNYRLPNLNAALGCAQLEQLPRFIMAKRALAKRYMEIFKGLPGLRILQEPKGTESNYWLAALMMERADKAWLERTLQALHDAGLMCRPVWMPLHQLPMYKNSPRADLALTENVSQRIINLPSSPALGLKYV